MCAHVQKVNTAVMNALPRPLSTSYTFLYPLHGKTFQVSLHVII